jgi:hypothetical protein
MLNLASETVEISRNDSYFMGSGGLSDANATYLSAAIIVPIVSWLLWKNLKQIDKD